MRNIGLSITTLILRKRYENSGERCLSCSTKLSESECHVVPNSVTRDNIKINGFILKVDQPQSGIAVLTS